MRWRAHWASSAFAYRASSYWRKNAASHITDMDWLHHSSVCKFKWFESAPCEQLVSTTAPNILILKVHKPIQVPYLSIRHIYIYIYISILSSIHSAVNVWSAVQYTEICSIFLQKGRLFSVQYRFIFQRTLWNINFLH